MGTDSADSGEPHGTEATATPAENGISAEYASTVAELEIEPGHTVKFYELNTGGVILIETQGRWQKSVLPHGPIDAIEIFRSLRPNEAVPGELSAAYERAKAVFLPDRTDSDIQSGSGAGHETVSGIAPIERLPDVGGIREATSSSSGAHFTGTHEACNATGSSFNSCRVNWGGGYWASWTSTSANCRVDHYAGNGITVQLTAGSTVIPSSQAVNTFQTYAWGLVGGDISRRLDVLNASGDSFHVGCTFFG